jgi:hypothetical protein
MEKLVKSIALIEKSDRCIAKKTIKQLFDHLYSEKFNEVLSDWQVSFSKIHGVFDTQRKIDIDALSSKYDVDLSKSNALNRFVFCLETYYLIILRLFGFKAVSDNKLEKNELLAVFDGSYFEKFKIFNYRCDEVYNWFIETDDFEELIEPIVKEFNLNEIGIYERDFIKIIFENIFNSKIRHSMGEFYTPDWLVDYVIGNLVSDVENPQDKKLLDPTCGSGSFIVDWILRYKKINSKIVEHVFGIDLNPVSVLAAKTNILLTSKSLIDKEKPFILPIFEGDVINNGDEPVGLYRYINLHTSIIISNTEIELSSNNMSYEQIIHVYLALKNELSPDNLSDDEERLFNTLKKYNFSNSEKEKLLSLLVIKFVGNFDLVVGNPPWVNWEYLPKEYRDKHVRIWQDYGLFDLKGMNKTFIKEDISALLTYAVVDKYLKLNGKLGFVLKETLFKSSKQAEGFRKFFIKKNSVPLKVLRVYDLTKIKPFPGVNNRTSILYLTKGKKTEYPVPYIVWEPSKKISINSHAEFNDVLKDITIKEFIAKPSDIKNQNSGWITLPQKYCKIVDKLLGKSYYKARTGVFTGGANAVFWVNILESTSDYVKIQNETKKAKKKVEECICKIEKDYVYPLLTGSELFFWDYQYSKYIICPHSAETKIYPISINKIKKSTPETFKYLNKFKDFLQNRKGFAGWERHILENDFHAIQRIGEYTFERYKVGWRYISRRFIVCVIDIANDKHVGSKIIIPNEKIIYVGLSDKGEAYYLCGILSSDFIRMTVESFMVETQIGPHVLDKLNIPKFDPHNPLHREISSVCEEGHQLENKTACLQRINELVKCVYECE